MRWVYVREAKKSERKVKEIEKRTRGPKVPLYMLKLRLARFSNPDRRRIKVDALLILFSFPLFRFYLSYSGNFTPPPPLPLLISHFFSPSFPFILAFLLIYCLTQLFLHFGYVSFAAGCIFINHINKAPTFTTSCCSQDKQRYHYFHWKSRSASPFYAFSAEASSTLNNSIINHASSSTVNKV